MGNITAGIDYIRRRTGKTAYGLTFPLLTRSDGKKFGKTEEGAIWLSKEKLSPYDFYQYLFRLPDEDVIRLLRMLTFLDMQEIQKLEKDQKSGNLLPNVLQEKLAEEVTRYVHGEEGLALAKKVTQSMKPGSEASLDPKVLENLKEQIPNVALKLDEIIGKRYIDIVTKIGLVTSKSEGRNLVKNRGAYLNNQKVEDPLYCFSEKDLIDESYLLLSAGKKKKLLIRIQK